VMSALVIRACGILYSCSPAVACDRLVTDERVGGVRALVVFFYQWSCPLAAACVRLVSASVIRACGIFFTGGLALWQQHVTGW